MAEFGSERQKVVSYIYMYTPPEYNLPQSTWFVDGGEVKKRWEEDKAVR